MTDINKLIQTCADITKAKGFDTTQHATQISLIATEVAEALECVSLPRDFHAAKFMHTIMAASQQLETHRMLATEYEDLSSVSDQEHLNEELADIVIRVFSYVGGNGQKDAFVKALTDKIGKNQERAYRHGKGF